MGKIENFQVETFETTKLKVKTTMYLVPELVSGVEKVCAKLNEIADTFKILTTIDMTSSDFYDECNQIITLARTINTVTKSYMGLILLDAKERIMSVGNLSNMFADEIASAQISLDEAVGSLAVIPGVSTSLIDISDASSGGAAPVEEPNITVGDASRAVTGEISPQAIVNDSAPVVGRVLPGTRSPGTTSETFAAQSYQLSDDEYRVLCATVYAEASELPDRVYSDTMGVTSTILNRVEANGFGGSTVTGVVSANGQFEGYGWQNSKFASAMNNPNVISPEMRATIDACLAGERNTHGYYFWGNGINNNFS